MDLKYRHCILQLGKRSIMITVQCPQCQQEIKFGSNPEIGQQIICLSCDTVLIVVWLYPMSLDYMENPVRTSADLGSNVGK